MARTTVALFLAACAFTASAASDKVSISFENTGRVPLGVFFVGNETDRRMIDSQTMTSDQLAVTDFELLTDVLNHNEWTVHKTHFHHAFELRSADFQFRVKVTVYKNYHHEVAHLPYIIMFKNLMSEETDGGPNSIELKHSNTGYVWIHPEFEEAHASDAEHFYELRNSDRESVAFIRLMHGHDEL